MVMGLLYMLTLCSMCVLYVPSIQWLFYGQSSLNGSFYRTYIFSGVGRRRLDLIMLLVLHTIAYNIRGTGVVLQVPRDSANSARKE